MTEINGELINEHPVFAAELVPHRSLGRRGWKVLMLLTGVLTVAHVAVFLMSGAWPVALFFGIDFALLYGAFYLNYRAGLEREEVFVSRTRLLVRKIKPSGQAREIGFNPFRARFDVKRHTDIGIVSMLLSGEGRRTDIGSFLNLDDRESFAKALTGALATVKRRI
ncbi:DUF2244 domain-containing protein [Gellertiella hungarica]|uniref:Putative membrane protein n=1 Tax=Gellertiella hungarica TaxID=1572859 RepID=A0A7W6NI40_9HYPH|nr:DUF2244 domain-containing protein [Gellertiella hungarica]MBB4062975.1 putative membrane protein [Gellertiella hungarica]